jgi:hypothetical protein
MNKLILSIFVLGTPFMAWSEETWTVAKSSVKGISVIYKFMNELPDEITRGKLPWLTVVSWKYDGSTNNGMPTRDVNDGMIELEDSLESIVGREAIYFDVYSATGNDLKEFVFYISDQAEFMENFNDAMSGKPRYPIEINFYEDKEWSDLAKLQQDFKFTVNK